MDDDIRLKLSVLSAILCFVHAWFSNSVKILSTVSSPASRRHPPNVGLMLGQRRGWWNYNNPIFGGCIVFAWIVFTKVDRPWHSKKDTLVESLVNDGPNSMTLDQWFSKVSPISRVAEMPFHWSFSLGMEILRRLFADDLTLSRVRDFTFVSTYTRAAIL